jgi:hypothetical protein
VGTPGATAGKPVQAETLQLAAGRPELAERFLDLEKAVMAALLR